MSPIYAHPLFGTDRFVLLRDAGKGRRARIDDRGSFCAQDAHQLAAAPDLVEALQRVRDRIEGMPYTNKGGALVRQRKIAIEEIDTALSKALGEGEGRG